MEMIHEVWDTDIDLDCCQSLTDSIPKRMKDVVKAKREMTAYEDEFFVRFALPF